MTYCAICPECQARISRKGYFRDPVVCGSCGLSVRQDPGWNRNGNLAFVVLYVVVAAVAVVLSPADITTGSGFLQTGLTALLSLLPVMTMGWVLFPYISRYESRGPAETSTSGSAKQSHTRIDPGGRATPMLGALRIDSVDVIKPAPMPDRRTIVTLLSAWIILCPCFSYVVVGDAPLIAQIALVVLFISIVLPRPMKITGRFIAYSITLAAVTTFVLNEAYPVETNRFFIPISTEVVFPFLITVAICLTFLPQRQLVLTAIIALSVFAYMLQGGTLNDPMQNARFQIHGGSWLIDRYRLFSLFLALQMAAVLPLLYFGQGNVGKVPQRSRRSRYFAYCCSVVLVVVMTGVTTTAYNRYYTTIEQMMSFVAGSRNASRIVFPNDVDLRRTVGPKGRDSQRVVLRTASESPPGYLRGRVFTSYDRGRWQFEPGVSILPSVGDEDLAIRAFFRDVEREQVDDQHKVVDILPAGNMYSDVLFATGDSVVVELVAESITNSADGVLEVKEHDLAAGYALRSKTLRQDSAYNSALQNSDVDDRYLALSDDMAVALAPLADAIFAGAPEETERKVRYLCSYLQNTYDYELGVDLGSSALDPVLVFLNEAKRGHCELFATSAALLLRTQGIPTRYVTGYVCMEPHPSEGYWMARLGDCHAWAEAWSAERGEWVMLEATPASGIPDGATKGSSMSRMWEHLVVSVEHLFSQVKRGYFARAMFYFFARVGGFLNWSFLGSGAVVAWPLLLLALFVCWRLYQRLHLDRLPPPPPPRLRDLQPIFDRLVQHLAAHQISRGVSTTIGELIERIKETDSPALAGADAILLDYQSLRFAPDMVSEVEITEFRKRVDRWLGDH
jgi:hypothetical protein